LQYFHLAHAQILIARVEVEHFNFVCLINKLTLVDYAHMVAKVEITGIFS